MTERAVIISDDMLLSQLSLDLMCRTITVRSKYLMALNRSPLAREPSRWIVENDHWAGSSGVRYLSTLKRDKLFRHSDSLLILEAFMK